MAEFTRITDEDLARYPGVRGQETVPRISVEEKQAKFEERAEKVIVPAFNRLVDELEEEQAAAETALKEENQRAEAAEQECMEAAKKASMAAAEATAEANAASAKADEAQTALQHALKGCWVEFTDEDGNPTDEPYIHWMQEVNE